MYTSLTKLTDEVAARIISKAGGTNEVVAFIIHSDGHVIYYNRLKTLEFSQIVGFILLVPAILVTWVTYSGLTVTRKRDISILAIVGATPRHVTWLFIIEATLMGFIGGLLGFFTALIMPSIGNQIINQILSILAIQGEMAHLQSNNSLYALLFALFLGLTACWVAVILPSRQASRLVVPSAQRKWYGRKQLLTTPKKGYITHQVPIRLPKELAFELWEDLYEFIMTRHLLDEGETGFRNIRRLTQESDKYTEFLILGARTTQGFLGYNLNPFEIRIIIPKGTTKTARVYIRTRVPQYFGMGGKTGQKVALELIDMFRREVLEFTTLRRKEIKKMLEYDVLNELKDL